MGGKHAICSPSGAEGWMNCPAWESNSTSSAYAREGTAAHELAENCLRTKKNAVHFYGQIITVEGEDFEVDNDMCEHVQRYLDLIRSIPGELMVEQKLPLEDITGEKDAQGTSDAVVLLDDILTVGDLKYGMGIRVSAVRNKQLMIYALSVVNKLMKEGKKISRIHMIICQPRLDNISEWDCSLEELLEFGETVKPAAAKKLAGSEEMNPSAKACEWCVKKATCPALEKYTTDLIADAFQAEIDPMIAVARKRDEELDAIYPKLELAKLWIESVEEYIHARLHDSADFKNVKVVAGKRGKRVFSDKVFAEKRLRELGVPEETFITRELLSPPKLEEALKSRPDVWEEMKPFVIQAAGKPVLASIDDKRPALVGTGTPDFQAIEKEE